MTTTELWRGRCVYVRCAACGQVMQMVTLAADVPHVAPEDVYRSGAESGLDPVPICHGPLRKCTPAEESVWRLNGWEAVLEMPL